MMNFTRSARTTLVALTVLVCAVPGQPSIHAQNAPPTFKSRVAVVPITAVVRDARNRVVRDLVRDDFDVLENSQVRQIVDFRSADNAPVSVALLFDTSGSMRGPNLERGKRVVDTLLRSLSPVSDEAALFTFDRHLRQETPFTSDMQRVWTALNTADAWGLTSLYDATADAAKAVAKRQHARRAVIVVTDGLDTSSTLTSSQVSGLASSIDVPVYIVAVVPPSFNAMGDPNGGDLSYLAYWTGGDVSHAVTTEETDRSVGKLITELRQQYLLAIESASAEGWYRLDVKTRRRGLTVRARTGYFSTPGGAELGGS